MANCKICGKPSIGYIQWYQGKKKVASYPACIEHTLVAYSLIELGQERLRDFLATSMPIKKGSVPRFKVSLTP